MIHEVTFLLTLSHDSNSHEPCMSTSIVYRCLQTDDDVLYSCRLSYVFARKSEARCAGLTSGKMNRLWLGLGLLVLAASAAASRVIRGAAPDIVDKYQPVDGKFTCFDGSKTIQFNQVNDNFCDCPDSSDEPGE